MPTPSSTTENHDFQEWTDQSDWEYNTDFQSLDTKVEIRDSDANKGNYTAKSGALFRATDTGDVYKGDGSSWVQLNPPNSASLPGEVRVGSGDTISGALSTVGPGGTVTITEGYDEGDTFPVTVSNTGVTIRGLHKGAGTTEATIHNDSGSDTFDLEQGNQFNPGVTLRDMNILQTSGGTAINVGESKFNHFENVHVDANGNGSDPAWLFDDPDDTLTPNSQVLVNCSAEQAGGDGFEFGNMAHHVAMFGCTALNCGRMGVYANGPYSFKFLGGQAEDCAEPGIRARQADSVYVGGGSYIEGNATTGNLGDAEVAFVDSSNCVVEGPLWANAKSGGSASAVRFDGVSTGAVRGIQSDGNHTAIAYITGSSDIDVYSASHVTGGASVATVQPDAVRVRDNGVIVGAGSNNGGNDGLNGVDLSAVSGAVNRDRAISDGTTASADGLTAVWLAGSSAWQPSDGGATI